MNKPAVVVESHHHVLPAWISLSRSLGVAPTLITLDHHTDTSKPFRKHLRNLSDVSTQKGEALAKEWLTSLASPDLSVADAALKKLSNDEHIVAAIEAGIISRALVLAHKAYHTDLETFRNHQIICRGLDPGKESKKIPREECDRVLESDFLREHLQGFDRSLLEAGEGPIAERPYILDIDLDYFNTNQSIRPKNPAVFLDLARQAALITIARESAYVRTCALDSELTSDSLLSDLMALLEQV